MGCALKDLGLAGSSSVKVCVTPLSFHLYHINIRQACLCVQSVEDFPFFFPDIRLLHEDFTEIGSTDPRLENVKVILLLPQCSGLGVGNPIDFIVNEHGGNF